MVEIIELPPDPQPRVSPGRTGGQDPKDVPKIVYIATPCYGCQLSVVYLASLLGLQSALLQRGVHTIVDFIGNESLVERARNIFVARFLHTEATHLLFIDADIGFRPESVLKLLDSDKDIATGVYSKKSFDWAQIRQKLEAGDTEPVHQMGLDFNINIASRSAPIEDGMVRVLDSATGFMLIKRRVLETMCEAYREELHCVNDIMNQPIKDYVALFACMIDPVTKRFLSEDYSFCRRYQKMGGEIWADLTNPLAHIGTNVFSGDITARD